nr:helix-turn-helix domain-containing protein [Aureibacillus halotolerans]
MKPLHHPATSTLQLPTVLYALSDSIRLSIVSSLSDREELACGNLSVPVGKSTVSHHVKTLREAGVVHVRTEGTHRFISLRREDLETRFPGLLAAVLRGYEPEKRA